jgi:hypothetical protein
MNKAVVLFAVAVCFLCGACNMVGVIGSKSYNEQKVPAEFMLKDVAQGGVLVFIDEAGSGRGELELRPGLSEVVTALLVQKARIKSENFVSGDRLSQLRDGREDFSSLSPVQLGRAAGASVVLYVLVEDYELYAVGEQMYHSGSLVARSILFDVASGRALWPRRGDGRVVKAKVEIETGGRAATLNRLIVATAHCITRKLYDCPRPTYRTADEEGGYSPQQW